METLSAQTNPRGGKLEGGHQPTGHGERPSRRSNRLTAQILECELVGGSHNKQVNSDMLSPALSHTTGCVLGACLKSLRPRRLWGERSGPPQATSYPKAPRGRSRPESIPVRDRGWKGEAVSTLRSCPQLLWVSLAAEREGIRRARSELLTGHSGIRG